MVELRSGKTTDNTASSDEEIHDERTNTYGDTLEQLVSKLHGVGSAHTIPAIGPPDKFSGTTGHARGFLAQIALYLNQPTLSTLPNNVKVNIVVSRLTGAAAEWAAPLLETNDAVLNDLHSFLNLIRHNFGGARTQDSARLELCRIKQRRLDIRQHAMNFRTLAVDASAPRRAHRRTIPREPRLVHNRQNGNDAHTSDPDRSNRHFHQDRRPN